MAILGFPGFDRGTRRTEFRVSGMSYHLFETADVPPATLAIVVSVFDEVCEQLRLSPVQDPLRDIVAQRILDCVRKGQIDQDELRACARNALRL